MKGEGINDLKKYLSTGKSLKVCILDNNSIEFLTWVRKRIGLEKIFEQYDMILIQIIFESNRLQYARYLSNMI
ncbi:hypothetical protein [Calorimonas adulescens]|uniref:hypothetical protein n=1 Tax=Calorimonas adulescens TaxID=2606906 RepID=UPI001EF0560F|nr:hypothetical protein [Calorimonas adulescens]